MAEWQPIETAPKDRLIIVCVAGVKGSTGEALWNGAAWETRDGVHQKFATYANPGPTHWQPLPPPHGVSGLDHQVKSAVRR